MQRVEIVISLESQKPAVPMAVLLRTFLKRCLRLGGWKCSSVTLTEDKDNVD